MIAAIGLRGELGFSGHLPWSVPEDLKHFKTTTAGCPLIMGRKTFESLPGILPGRPHCILSRNPQKSDNPRVQWYSDLLEIQEWCAQHQYSQAFVIGGKEIFQLLHSFCEEAIITHILTPVLADVFFDLEWIQHRPIVSKTELSSIANVIYYGKPLSMPKTTNKLHSD